MSRQQRKPSGFSTALRHDLFAHIQSFSYADLDRFGSSTLITRITGDINQVQTGINLGLRLLLRSPFVVFGALIMACSIDPGSALVFGGVILALFLIVFGIILGTMPLQKKVREGLDGVTAATPLANSDKFFEVVNLGYHKAKLWGQINRAYPIPNV